MRQTRTWLITGCSTGIGRGIAEAVLQKGENAVVTARDKSRVKNFEERYPGKALAVTLDMEKPETIAQAVEQAQERFGSVDVLINNAGHGYRAALEEGEPAAVAELFQTNFFGPIELIKLVLSDGGGDGENRRPGQEHPLLHQHPRDAGDVRQDRAGRGRPEIKREEKGAGAPFFPYHKGVEYNAQKFWCEILVLSPAGADYRHL